MEPRRPLPMLSGECRFLSYPLSNEWVLAQGDEQVAFLRRFPRRHTSTLTLADGRTFELEPRGWGTVVALEAEVERGRITRRSWWGRAWDLTSATFGYGLTSDVMPRRWTLRVGNEPVGRLAGTLLSYNRLRVHTDVAVPVLPLALAWHVLARPWEAAAAPGSLVPQQLPITEPRA